PASAGRVAPADVNGARDAAHAFHGEVVDLGVRGQLGCHVVAPALEGRAVVGVDVPLGVVRSVELDVVAAALDEPGDDTRAQVVGDGAQADLRSRIGGARLIGTPVEAVNVRTRDR